MAKIGVAGPCGQDQGIEGDGAAIFQRDPTISRIDPGDHTQQRGHLLAFAHQEADRPGDFRSREGCRPYLVEQRLE